MKKYRIKQIKKDGCFNLYRVESRSWLFFWEPRSNFDTLDQAKSYILRLKREDSKPVTSVVHKE